jgi:putative ABC transport system substrate-binding protein
MLNLRSNKIKWLSAALLTIYGSLTLSEPENLADKYLEKNTKRVAIIQNVEHPALNAARQGILDELQKHKIKIDFDSAQGNPTLALQIAQKFVGSSPNVMVGIGTTSTQALMAANHQHNIPIVFCSVTDPIGAKLVNTVKTPEASITGVSDFIDPKIQFDLFKKILPNLSKVGVIYSPGELNSITLNEQMKKVSSQYGLTLTFVAANTSAEVSQATQKLLGDKVQAIFINNDNVALSAFGSIVKIASENNTPVFCSDTDMVSRGALAAIGPNHYEEGKLAGKMILKILNGEKIRNISVTFPEKTEIHLNLKKAIALKITFPQALLSEATQVIK